MTNGQQQCITVGTV